MSQYASTNSELTFEQAATLTKAMAVLRCVRWEIECNNYETGSSSWSKGHSVGKMSAAADHALDALANALISFKVYGNPDLVYVAKWALAKDRNDNPSHA